MELVTSHFQKLDTLYKSNIISKEVYDRIKTEFSGRDNYLPKSGYLISSVSHSGTAQKSGVLVGDLLVKYNTKAITSDEDLSNAIKSSTLTGNTILVARNGQLFSLACDPGRLGIDGRIV
jgi:S1-C subfamily serine protease